MKILSAGSTVYGVRAALSAAPRPDLAVETDHGHDIHSAVVEGRADADIVIAPADMLEDLDRRALLRGPRRAIGMTGIGMAVRAGRAAPDAADAAGLGEAVLQASALYLTTAPTGEHMRACFADLGLAEAIAPRLRLFDRATEMLAALAQSDVGTLAFGPTTELLAWRDRGVAYGGAVPFEFDLPLRYDAAVLARSPRGNEAGALLDWLAGPGLRFFRDSGVE